MEGLRLGYRLENLREKSGYTKKEISYKLGFSSNVYGTYESGETHPAYQTLAELADLFNVSLDYLIRENKYQKN
ncbi:MAG TPA: helix-turn-helix transcriptional regulator [Candidatus Avamphibacillus sp.]|nr:helix-turn-helix transcriptional regulator [Candidatus Avamphibacillus sp.]